MVLQKELPSAKIGNCRKTEKSLHEKRIRLNKSNFFSFCKTDNWDRVILQTELSFLVSNCMFRCLGKTGSFLITKEIILSPKVDVRHIQTKMTILQHSAHCIHLLRMCKNGLRRFRDYFKAVSISTFLWPFICKLEALTCILVHFHEKQKNSMVDRCCQVKKQKLQGDPFSKSIKNKR